MADFGAPSKWMWLPVAARPIEDVAYIALFRRTFNLGEDHFAEKRHGCVLRVSADSRYKLYVNGAFVNAGPCKGDDKVRYYDEIDIAPWLAAGKNVIAVEVLRYPARSGAGNHSVFRAEKPGLYVEEIHTGSKDPIDQTWQDMRQDAAQPDSHGRIGLSASDAWRCRLLPGFEIVPENPGFAPLQIYENRVGDAALAGWTLAGYQEDAEWLSAAVYNALEISRATVPGNLMPRPIPFMRRNARRFKGIKALRESAIDIGDWNRFLVGDAPVTLAPDSETVVEIDAGEEMCGYPSLRLSGGGGAQFEILYAEAYATSVTEAPDGQRFCVKADRCDSEHGMLVGNADHYSVAGYGRDGALEVYTPYWFRTFRFVQLRIRTSNQPLTLADFDYEETGYPLEVKSRVVTGDSSYVPIWDVSLRTLKRCMHETYMDCPYYEQLQYAMDARNEILYTYAVSMDDRLARQCMDDFRRSQRSDGLLNSCYPNCEANVIPGFSIYYILMLYDHMMYFGDRALLREHLPCVDSILNAFDRKLTPDGLVGNLGGVLMEARYWSFIDWTPQWNATVGVPDAVLQGPITMESMLYLLGLSAAADICRWLGRNDTAREYEDRADALRKAINEHCRNTDGMYTDGPGFEAVSQHGQVFAILTGCISAEEGRALLLPTLEEPEKYAQCSVSMMYYLFRALEMTGLYEWADRKWDIWRGMVKMNLSTCVEDGVTGRSDCHAWGALALYEWPSTVLGVRPGAPGYEVIRIQPILGALECASGDVVTKCGTVHVEWKKAADGTLEIHYTAPEGVQVEVCKAR